jgi:hypothetical protein
MSIRRGRGILSLTVTVLLLAFALVACGWRDFPAAVGAVASPGVVLNTPNPAALATSVAGATLPGPTGPAATEAPTPTPTPTSAATPAATPAPTPDLTTIQRLLDEIDADLGADATADTDEGSSQ